MGKPGCITETVGSWMAFEINVAPSIPRVWSAQNSKGLTRSEFQEQGRQINSALMIYVTFLKSYENIGKVAVTIEQVNQESPTETVELDGWHSSHTSVSHTERIKIILDVTYCVSSYWRRRRIQSHPVAQTSSRCCLWWYAE
jgi:hypothetical protein